MRIAVIAMVALVTAWAGGVRADAAAPELLAGHYRTYQAQVTAASHFPYMIRSGEQQEYLSADVYGVIGRALEQISSALIEPTAWCRFVPLNLNIKACVVREAGGLLQFYGGRKFYQTPAEAYPIEYRFKVAERQQEYIRVELSAAEGPVGTRDYTIVVEAMAVEGGSFVHIHTGHQTSLRSRLATQLYLSTKGRHKIGFTVEGEDEAGQPAYIKGFQGIVERNTVRYFLALTAFLDSPGDAFEARLKLWFDATERYSDQLHEMEWPEYREAKLHERQNQLQLQGQDLP